MKAAVYTPFSLLAGQSNVGTFPKLSELQILLLQLYVDNITFLIGNFMKIKGDAVCVAG